MNQWPLCPEAEKLIEEALLEATQKNQELRNLSESLLKQTSSRLFDWIDHVVIDMRKEPEVEKGGFKLIHSTSSMRVFAHPDAQLPKIILTDELQVAPSVAVSVDSIADFLLVHAKEGFIEGAPCSGYRRALISRDKGSAFWVIERRSVDVMEPTYPDAGHLERYFAAEEKWASRPRGLEDESEAMRLTLKVAEEMVKLVGEEMAAWIVLHKERLYWQARNRAGQIQKNRQDTLGMGWANHDHHTFRSSRQHFHHLVRLFEMLGFRIRERYYTGQEAGWGAQIMDHPKVRLVLFLDVDLLPEELSLDFAHQPLSDSPTLGTIGLWCALHGDSILKAGMHHLEAQFLFDDLKKDLEPLGVSMMEPFSRFDYLKQAFTQGELWPVEPRRLEKLLRDGLITPEQKSHFAAGALGSHLENLQRRQGYKGFNQKNVSFIIKKTDPRN